jgi:phage gpG-like protein
MEKFGIDIRSFHEPLKRSIQQVIIPSINMNFDWEGRPEWTPLADYTLTRRNNEGFGEGPILQRTGRLRARATAFARWKVTREEAFVDNFPSDVWYAQVQHEGIGISGSQLAQQKGVDTSSMKGEGGMFPRKKGEVVIPPRPFMLVQEEDLDKIEDVFKEWIRERMFKAGLLT